MKLYILVVLLFAIIWIALIAYIVRHDWDNMGRACDAAGELTKDCYLKSIGVYPEERKGIGTCVCATKIFDDYVVEEKKVDLRGNVWYKIHKLLD